MKIALFFALLIAANCGAAEPREDVSYVETSDAYRAERGRLDLYVPAKGGNFPVLIWFHGGGLTGGDKGNAAKLGEALAGGGIAAVVPNYRLSPRAIFPAYVEDAAAAVAWVRAHARELHIDPTRIYVGGHSAGAYLASLLAMDPRYLRQAGLAEKDVAGFIPVSGQMMTHFAVRAERKIDENTVTADEAAPIYFLRKDTRPMLILMGDADWPARREENAYFAAAAKAVGNNGIEMHVIADRDHGSIVGKMTEPDDPGMKLIKAFILPEKSGQIGQSP